MNGSFATAWYFAALLFFIGLYCMAASRNLLRQLIGLEVMSKGTLLALIASGSMSNLSLAQAVIITMIVIEVVVVAAGLAARLRLCGAHRFPRRVRRGGAEVRVLRFLTPLRSRFRRARAAKPLAHTASASAPPRSVA